MLQRNIHQSKGNGGMYVREGVCVVGVTSHPSFSHVIWKSPLLSDPYSPSSLPHLTGSGITLLGFPLGP